MLHSKFHRPIADKLRDACMNARGFSVAQLSVVNRRLVHCQMLSATELKVCVKIQIDAKV